MRRHDWASRLFDVATDHMERPFAWGKDDCCLFVVRAVDAMTDSQLEATLGELYQDEAGALQLIQTRGDLKGAVSEFLGSPVSERAKRCDVVLFEGGTGHAVGICFGAEVRAMGPQGMQRIRREEIEPLAVWVIA